MNHYEWIGWSRDAAEATNVNHQRTRLGKRTVAVSDFQTMLEEA